MKAFDVKLVQDSALVQCLCTLKRFIKYFVVNSLITMYKSLKESKLIQVEEMFQRPPTPVPPQSSNMDEPLPAYFYFDTMKYSQPFQPQVTSPITPISVPSLLLQFDAAPTRAYPHQQQQVFHQPVMHHQQNYHMPAPFVQHHVPPQATLIQPVPPVQQQPQIQQQQPKKAKKKKKQKPTATITSLPIVQYDAPLEDSIWEEITMYKSDGHRYFREGKHEDALHSYGMALALLPSPNKKQSNKQFADHYGLEAERALLHANRAACFLKIGAFENVIAETTLSLKFEPKHVKSLYRRAYANEQLHYYDAAMRDYEAAIALNGNSNDLQDALVRVRAKLGQ